MTYAYAHYKCKIKHYTSALHCMAFIYQNFMKRTSHIMKVINESNIDY